MDIDIRIEQDKTGRYIARYPKIPYCLSQGASEKEARDNINLLIRDWIETDRILAAGIALKTENQYRNKRITIREVGNSAENRSI